MSMTNNSPSTSGEKARPTSMNHYGALALTHWKTHRPTQYAELENPKEFFSQLGEEISQRVQQLRLDLEAAERPILNQMQDLERIGRLNAIRKQAEELVFEDLVWPQAPEGLLPEDESPETSEPPGDRLWRLGAVLDEDGALMPRDRHHPVWSLWQAATSDEATSEQAEAFDRAYREWLAAHPELIP